MDGLFYWDANPLFDLFRAASWIERVDIDPLLTETGKHFLLYREKADESGQDNKPHEDVSGDRIFNEPGYGLHGGSLFWRFYRSVILAGSNLSRGDFWGPPKKESCLSNGGETHKRGKGFALKIDLS